MKCQMILVISSPSISTTGFTTLILDMPLLSLHRCGPGAGRGSGRVSACAGSTSPATSRPAPSAARTATSASRRLDTSMPARRSGQRQPGQGGCEQNPSHRQRTPSDILSALPDPCQRQRQAAEHDRVREVPPALSAAGRPCPVPARRGAGARRCLRDRGGRRRGVPHRASARPLDGFPGMCLPLGRPARQCTEARSRGARADAGPAEPGPAGRSIRWRRARYNDRRKG